METKLEMICSKLLKPSHISHGVDIPRDKLNEFPEIPRGKNYVIVPVTDEAGRKWNFRLATRTIGPYLKPIIASTDWFKFIRTNHVLEGDKITLCKEINPANGEVIGYKAKLEAPGAVRIMGSVCGRD